MNPNPTITAEETRLLRREARGLGNLARLGLITLTDKGRQFIAQDDERVKAERAAGGKVRYIGPRRRREIAAAAAAAREEKRDHGSK